MRFLYKTLMHWLFVVLSKYKNGVLWSAIFDFDGPYYCITLKSGKIIKFFTPGTLPFYRANTLLTKEPETIEWLNKIKKDEVLYDIGANVGTYSVYAALESGAEVYSFEPAFMNYSLLNQNIYANNLHDKVTAFCVGLGNKNEATKLYMPAVINAMALVNMGESVDHEKKPMDAKFSQGILSYTLDQFISQYKLPQPNHLKIDVDGLEPQIIEGAFNTLRSKTLKSISIEINENNSADHDIVPKIIDAGFHFVHKKHAQCFEGTKFQATYNYLFERA